AGTQPAQPEPGTRPAQPEPGTRPAQPEPGTRPAQPEPGTRPAQPEPGTRPPGYAARDMIVMVGGVAGSGKSTVGAMVADRLGWRYADADSFHPAANIAKMRSGAPLTDADRKPWLAAITTWMDARIAAGESAVAGCSGLKRRYRDDLLDG